MVLPQGFKRIGVDKRIAPDTSDYIEEVIQDEYADAIYRSELVSDWMEENQIEPLGFGGGVVAITVDMLSDIPITILKK